MKILRTKRASRDIPNVVSNLVASGNDIYFLARTKEYFMLIGYDAVAVETYFILQESGSFILQENGDKLIQEQAV